MPRNKRKTTKRARRTAAAPQPRITLDGNRIVVSGCTWAPSQKTSSKLVQAGATSIGMATASTSGVIQFPDEATARKVFESMFTTESDEWGLDNPEQGGLPDDIDWVDPIGFGQLAEQVVRGR